MVSEWRAGSAIARAGTPSRVPAMATGVRAVDSPPAGQQPYASEVQPLPSTATEAKEEGKRRVLRAEVPVAFLPAMVGAPFARVTHGVVDRKGQAVEAGVRRAAERGVMAPRGR